jgi:hypothetical protein
MKSELKIRDDKEIHKGLDNRDSSNTLTGGIDYFLTGVFM